MSFGTCVTCLGRLLCDVEFFIGMTHIGNNCPFGGDEGSFFLQCGVCTIDFVCTNDQLLCARYFVVENVLYHDVVEIVPAHSS